MSKTWNNFLHEVEQFNYLGCVITNDSECVTELKAKIDLDKNCFVQKEKVDNLKTECFTMFPQKDY